MKQCRTQVFFLPAESSVTRAFTTGVSLHSHTEHSQEKLVDFPRYLEQMPVVSHFFRRERERYFARHGESVDFSRAYWRGPLGAEAAYEVERTQIERLDLRALVSLTDHDNLEAGLLLQKDRPAGEIPVSVEWTVPYEQTYFHMGVHNIAPAEAVSCMQILAQFTRDPQSHCLGHLLEMLDASPAALLVLNHPLWDLAGVGPAQMIAVATRFLQTYGTRIHALEINGLRSWQENLATLELAKATGYPVVTGGDRHGLEPNAMINLTRASTFAEFVQEVREERSSDMAILPQYREPLAFRHLLCAWDVVREHSQNSRQKAWIGRIFVRCPDGIDRPLSAFWTRGVPPWIDPCLNVIGVLASPPVRTAARLAYQAAGASHFE